MTKKTSQTFSRISGRVIKTPVRYQDKPNAQTQQELRAEKKTFTVSDEWDKGSQERDDMVKDSGNHTEEVEDDAIEDAEECREVPSAGFKWRCNIL